MDDFVRTDDSPAVAPVDERHGRNFLFARRRTLAGKLSLLTAVAAGVALALSCIAFFVNDVRAIRNSKSEQLSVLATILGSNAAAAIEFNDAKTATELLTSLREQPAVQFACLYDRQGEVFATYPAHPPKGSVVPPAPSADRSVFTDSGHLDVSQSIDHDGEKVGSIYVRSGMGELQQQIWDYA